MLLWMETTTSMSSSFVPSALPLRVRAFLRCVLCALRARQPQQDRRRMHHATSKSPAKVSALGQRLSFAWERLPPSSPLAMCNQQQLSLQNNFLASTAVSQNTAPGTCFLLTSPSPGEAVSTLRKCTRQTLKHTLFSSSSSRSSSSIRHLRPPHRGRLVGPVLTRTSAATGRSRCSPPRPWGSCWAPCPSTGAFLGPARASDSG